MKTLKSVKVSITKNLLDLNKKVKKETPLHKPINKTISLKKLSSLHSIETILNSFNIPKKCRFLYVLKFQKPEQAQKAKDLYTSSKNKNPNLAFSRINQQEQISTTFYVGSSKNIKTRLKQHFGYGPQGTYSLHMNTWTKSLEGEIQVQILCFDEKIDTEVLNTIEDAYSRKLKPIFGRRGSL